MKRERENETLNQADLFGLKMLVTSGVAGSIIGKGGTIIAEIKQETGSRIHLSGNNEFFPGTRERVVLLIGAADSVKAASKRIAAKVHESVLHRVEKSGNDYPASVELSVTISLPSGAVGSVMGRGGSNLKEIQNATSTKLQLAQREECRVYPSERLCHIKGEAENINSALDLVIDRMLEDPSLAKYQNNSCSYTQHQLFQPARPGQQSAGGIDTTYMNAALQLLYGNQGLNIAQAMGLGGTGASGSTSKYPGIAGAGQTSSNPLAGYTGLTTNASAAYGAGTGLTGGSALGASLAGLAGGLGSSGATGLQSSAASSLQSAYGSGITGSSSYGGAGGLPSLSSLSGITSAAASAPGASQMETTVTMHVPHEQVGSLIGRGGSVISEINRNSGASLHISAKGEFAPGTTSRIVTIKGTNLAVQQAQYMVNARLAEYQQTLR